MTQYDICTGAGHGADRGTANNCLPMERVCHCILVALAHAHTKTISDALMRSWHTEGRLKSQHLCRPVGYGSKEGPVTYTGRPSRRCMIGLGCTDQSEKALSKCLAARGYGMNAVDSINKT